MLASPSWWSYISFLADMNSHEYCRHYKQLIATRHDTDRKVVVECHFTDNFNSYNEKPSCKMHDDYHVHYDSHRLYQGGAAL